MQEPEIFRRVPNYRAQYEISNLGRIRNIRNNRLLHPELNEHDYWVVRLGHRTRLLHYLVYETFVSTIPNNSTIVFIDGNKNNPILSNLELKVR